MADWRIRQARSREDADRGAGGRRLSTCPAQPVSGTAAIPWQRPTPPDARNILMLVAEVEGRIDRLCQWHGVLMDHPDKPLQRCSCNEGGCERRGRQRQGIGRALVLTPCAPKDAQAWAAGSTWVADGSRTTPRRGGCMPGDRRRSRRPGVVMFASKGRKT